MGLEDAGPIDEIRELEPTPLDNVAQEPTPGVFFPVPRRGGAGEEFVDIPEVPAGVFDVLSNELKFLHPDEAELFTTFSTWMNLYANGQGQEAQAIRDAVSGLVDQFTPKDNVANPQGQS